MLAPDATTPLTTLRHRCKRSRLADGERRDGWLFLDPTTNALHPKAAYWIEQGLFDELQSFEAFEARVNKIVGEKDRGDAFETFVEGYLGTQTITQRVKHWVVGNIPLSLRERYKSAKGRDRYRWNLRDT